jgi:selenocysteine-specific elongation factor
VRVIATAGHVDHGKSTLVRALTGMDPDRLAEERQRGLTIDLGFAWTRLEGGQELAFVDVPGHVRFIKNMLAGVGAVDACLFVVAATEGWKPQSEEHLRILELLGVGHGLVALTKVAGLDGEERELARLEVSQATAGSFLEGAEVVEVDAPAGLGVGELAAALGRLADATPPAPDSGRPRLWVDRCFSARGSGTVVTGTLTGGGLSVGDEVEVVGGRPGPLPARVRGLQSHMRAHHSLGPGRRAAVNLAGPDPASIGRGAAVVRPGQWFWSDTLDCSLQVLAGLGHPVSRRGAYQAYIGSGEHPVRLRLLGQAELAPGQAGLVRLHLPTALPLLPGDRYVLREAGRSETVGGGEVLDVDPVLPASRARPDRSVRRVVAERGWVEADLLERLTGQRLEPNVAGRWVVDPELLARTQAQLEAEVDRAGPLGLDLVRLDQRRRAVAAQMGSLVLDSGRARRRDAAPLADALGAHPWLAALRRSPFSPPAPEGVGRDELAQMVRQGLVVEHSGIHFPASALEEASRQLSRLLADHPEGVTVAQVRDALGTTRKFLLPLLGLLDARGVTRRRGDLRLAGPALARQAARPGAGRDRSSV